MPVKPHLTIMDDNKDLLEVLTLNLSSEFVVQSFIEPEEGINFLRNHESDILLLDLHFPKHDGFQLFARVKEFKSNLPVLFLSGDINIDTKIRGLELGADDFLTKPIEMQEIAARLKNRIAAVKKREKTHKVISLQGLTVDIDAHLIKVDGKQVFLTPKEYEVLLLLIQNPNKVITKYEIIHILWPNVHVEANNLDTHFSNLRRKLRPFSSHIKTLKNLGYVLRI